MARRRNSLRLPGYDYAAAGAYFVTTCAAKRAPLFGTLRDSGVALTEYGRTVEMEWQRTVTMWCGAALDEFIVMPDHVHAIVWLNIADGPDNLHPVGADWYPPTARQPADLKSLMRGFKGAVTTAINTERNTPGRPVWQRGYFDRVIRSERELDTIRRYVRFNVEKCLMMRRAAAP